MNMGAKNHGVIMPDAKKEDTLNALVGSAFGSSGQRCMALPVNIFVGETKKWIPDLVEISRKLKLGPGKDPTTDIGPLQNSALKQKIENYITLAEKEGCKILLDGRNPKVPGYEKGNFLGPTIIDGVTTGMESYKEEIFGPTL